MANEVRLILLDHALQAVSEKYRSDMPKHELDVLIATRKRLKAMPTVDAVEVVHGRWVWRETGEEDYEMFWSCSKCGDHTYFETNYCPNCGAKMDGDGNG